MPLGVMWPSNAVTPKELGCKGWDDNEAIEWLTGVMPSQAGPAYRRRLETGGSLGF
jgi:hypothetical protein